MRKLRRVALIISTAIALMAIVLWGISNWWYISVSVPADDSDGCLSLSQIMGRVNLRYDRGFPGDEEEDEFLYVEDAREVWDRFEYLTSFAPAEMDVEHPYDRYFECGTHAIRVPKTGQMWTGWSLRFPHWWIAMVFGFWPTVRGIFWYRKQREGA